MTGTPQDDLVRKVAEAIHPRFRLNSSPALVSMVNDQACRAIAVVRAHDADRDAWEQTAMDASQRFVRCAAERDAALARLAAVGEVHRPTPGSMTDSTYCHEDAFDWPCVTARAAFPDQPEEQQ